MPDRKTALAKLAVGDIFHGESTSGASLICLVTSVTEETIMARTMTTQLSFQFDRRTGIAQWGAELNLCSIDSTAPLPMEIHNVLLGLDQRYRLGQEPERFRLTDAEKRALVFVASYYPANLLLPHG